MEKMKTIMEVRKRFNVLREAREKYVEDLRSWAAGLSPQEIKDLLNDVPFDKWVDSQRHTKTPVFHTDPAQYEPIIFRVYPREKDGKKIYGVNILFDDGSPPIELRTLALRGIEKLAFED